MNHLKKSGISSKMSPTKFLSVCLFFASFLLFSNFSSAQVQTQKAVNTPMGSYIGGYYESLPVGYSANPTKKYPLLIFIHGKGELGNGSSQLSLVLKNGPPKLLNEGKFPSSFTVGGKTESFIVISPQINTYNYALSSTFVNQILDYCRQKYRVDDQRIYITGLSMGGYIGWSFVTEAKANADKIAAVVFACTGPSSSSSRITNAASSKLPVWFTTNQTDPVVSAAASTTTVNALNAYVPAPPKAILSVFPASGHDAWTKTYDPNFRQDGKNVYEWMLSYSRGTTSQPSPAPAAPIANAGSNQVITLPTNSITLDGTKSSASGGSIVSYTWSKVSGSTATITSASSSKTTVTGLVAGSYQFKLTIKDSNGNTASSTVTVTVNAASSTSTLKSSAGSNQTITLPLSSVTLDGTGSSGPAGLTHLWKQTGGPKTATIVSIYSIKTVVSGLTTAGDYSFQLELKDTNGNTATSTVHIIVNAAPPTSTSTLKPNAGSDQTITLPLSTVTLDGTGSSGPVGLTHIWKQAGGPKTATIVSIYSIKTVVSGLTTAGDYSFQLELTDSKGNKASSTVHIIVKPSSSTVTGVMHSNAGPDQTITQPVSTVTLNGSKSTLSSNTVEHLWEQTQGPVIVNISNPYSINSVVTGLTKPGDYLFLLTLKSSDGKKSGNYIRVTVVAGVSSSASTELHSNAGPDQTIKQPASSVMLDGTRSTWTLGNVTHIWTQTSGPVTANVKNPYSIKTDVTGLTKTGDYLFLLTLTSGSKVSKNYVRVTVVSNVSARVSSDAGTGEIQTVDAIAMAGPLVASSSMETIALKVNPNPVASSMNVQIEGKATGKASLKVYNMQGQILLQQAFLKDQTSTITKSFDVSGLASGVYIAEVIVDNRYKQVIRVVKQ